MSRKWITSWLAAWLVGFLAVLPAPAQNLRDMQIFGPADVSTYGGGIGSNEGYFFVFDGLIWSISSPDATTIGRQSDVGRVVWYGPDESQTATHNNSHTTGFLQAEFVGGQRIEFGCVTEHSGWLVSTYWLQDQTQCIQAPGLIVLWEDREWGGPQDYKHLQGYVDSGQTQIENLPVVFDDAVICNQVDTWSVELMYTYRLHPLRYGGNFELFAGVRYMEFNEQFNVEATGGLLDASSWYTRADNHIVGPQVGARWSKKRGRWTLSAEGRFFAGYNNQNIRQNGELGTNLTPPGGTGELLAMGPSPFNHRRYFDEFSPGAELRVEAKWQWTKAISFGAGWTGFYLDGIARPSNMINYELAEQHTMGITDTNHQQDVFVNGLQIHVDVNR